MTYDIIHDAPIHPDDVALFADLYAQAKRVAARYGLDLRSIEHLPHERCDAATTDRLGECVITGPTFGNIGIMLRARTDNHWCDEPRDPANVRRTLAHGANSLAGQCSSFRSARINEALACCMRSPSPRSCSTSVSASPSTLSRAP